MDSKRRKLGVGKYERRPQRSRRIEEDEEDELEVEDPRFASDKDDSSEPSEGEEEEDEDDEDGDEDEDDNEIEDEDEEDESEAEPEVEAPPSPSEGLTFGQILKQQEKKAVKQKGKTSEKTGSKTAQDREKDAKESTKEKTKAPRSSKHAPAEVSSRFAVKRGRDWLHGDATIAGVDVRPHEMRARDPRFFLASMAGPASARDVERARRNYAFLDEYRDNEMEQLRQSLAGADKAVKAVRKSLAKSRKQSGTKQAEQMQQRLEAAEQTADELRRQLTSMQARRKDRVAKQKEQAVLEEHKQRERELVRQGKKPFFLKRSEQKKQLLVDKFAGMTEQQAEKAMERRRKKLASRERREMPVARRG